MELEALYLDLVISLAGETSDEELDEFLDNLGKKPAMQSDFSAKTLLEDPEIVSITNVGIASQTMTNVSKSFGVNVMPPVGEVKAAGTIATDDKQKRNIEVVAYALTTRGYVLTADEIYAAWPTEGDVYKLQRAGKRPSLTAIVQYMETERFAEAMKERGVEFAPNPSGLSDEQEALLSILSDPALRGGLAARLKKAGISSSKFRAWKRQRAFNDAYKKLIQIEREDASETIDLQLISLASNGDLNAIKYYNDLVGRGPNDKKAVDAVQFSKIILESVMKHVSPEQLKAISAEVEFASKQLGM